MRGGGGLKGVPVSHHRQGQVENLSPLIAERGLGAGEGRAGAGGAMSPGAAPARGHPRHGSSSPGSQPSASAMTLQARSTKSLNSDSPICAKLVDLNFKVTFPSAFMPVA